MLIEKLEDRFDELGIETYACLIESCNKNSIGFFENLKYE